MDWYYWYGIIEYGIIGIIEYGIIDYTVYLLLWLIAWRLFEAQILSIGL